MAQTNLTAHRAAALERAAWMAKIRRISKAANATIKNADQLVGFQMALDALYQFGATRVARYERRRGGLGHDRKTRAR